MVETKFQTSFIPKAPVNAEPRHSGGASILFLISFLMLIASAAAAIGVFVWKKTVEKNIAQGKAALEQHNAAFDSKSISEFTRLDNRIDVASLLLKQHVSASEIFPRLASNTLRTVRFTNFSYTNGGSGKILISMTGEAQDYESMALQAQQFTKPTLQNAFRSPIFSNFKKEKDLVVFTFGSGIDPFVIDYYQTRIGVQKAAGRTPTQPLNPANQ